MRLRFSTRGLLWIVTLAGVLFGLIGWEFARARGEQQAYRELCRLGASGDDWVGWRELFFGRQYAPIVQISLPEAVPLQLALPHLKLLDNLEAVE